MNAKEVYFNEAGKKVTVKLLHFPEVPPEEVDKLKFEEIEKEQQNIINGNNPNFYTLTTEREIQCDEEDEDEEDEETIITSEQEEDEENAADEDEAEEAATCKKTQRKKSVGNPFLSRKVSMAFAQAHGLAMNNLLPVGGRNDDHGSDGGRGNADTSGTGVLPKTPPPTPTIMIPPKSFGVEAIADKFLALRKSVLLNRRSPSPNGLNSLCPGYVQYSKSLLEVPLPRDYGYASSDDLSSEWESDANATSSSSNHQIKKVSLESKREEKPKEENLFQLMVNLQCSP
uniref:Uncharacterized protein n=1 Tax=Glossina pallidipes TaxID=7398 RepID=A0A1A9ZEE0_GLOPL